MKKTILIMLLSACLLLSACAGGAQSGGGTSYQNVDGLLARAEELYEAGEYVEALSQYSEAMKENPVDVRTMIGAAKCQTALGNYDLAYTNLSAAVRIDPKDEKTYDAFIDLLRASESLSLAQEVIELARTNRMESFLQRIPESPRFSSSGGSVDAPLEVSIESPDGADIVVTESKSGFSSMTHPYEGPIGITRGNTTIRAYCIRDGLPSETISVTFDCYYPPVEVSFVDPVIEQIARETLGKLSGPITDEDCEGITELDQYTLIRAGMSWNEYENIHVSSLEDFRYFTNLNILSLENATPGIDYSPLSSCRMLWSLDLNNCGLTDISFLEKMPFLGWLRLQRNEISDLSPLANCDDLYGLYILQNPVTDLSPILDKDIYYFSVSACNFQDLSFLANWKNLYTLELGQCGGRDLSFLGSLTSLQSLNLNAEGNYLDYESTPITDISFVSKMPNLDYLYLYGMDGYTQLDVIKQLTQLQTLIYYPLEYEKMPAEVFADLQKSLPNCEIYSWN